MSDPQLNERQAVGIARVIGMVARLDGIDVTNEEITAALLTCPAGASSKHEHEECHVVQLMQRKAAEQGVEWGCARH